MPQNKHPYPEYTVLGDDLTGFWLQAGFVEGIEPDGHSFNDIPDAFRHIFRRNKEYAIILWNGIPIRLSYIDDIPIMIEGVVDVLRNVLSQNGTNEIVHFKTPNFVSQWIVSVDTECVTIDSKWIYIKGNYEAAINALCLLRMNKTSFLNEWKLLLSQLVHAFSDSHSKLNKIRDINLMKELVDIEETILKRGRFYQYDNR